MSFTSFLFTRASSVTLFVYELNFSPLDPELGMVSVAGFQKRKRLCTVEVHDTNPDAVVANLRFFCEGPLCKAIDPVVVPRDV